jgi:hypothetical protein
MDKTTRDRLRQAIIDEIDSLEASARVLKSRLNELAPISRLPCEVLATIFSFLPVFALYEGEEEYILSELEWIYVAHVCRLWRETALNHPRFWSHVNFTGLTSVGMAEILSRAKMAPLHLEADFNYWDVKHLEDFGKQLEAHISHTLHLKVSGYCLPTVVNNLVSPAPTLESLCLRYRPRGDDPPLYTIFSNNLFNCTAPSLTALELERCDIDWKLPLLKGLRTLKIDETYGKTRSAFNDWLDALTEMSQLKQLSLRHVTPRAPLAEPRISRTVTLPSLTHFSIDTSAKNCALTLAHLVLPTLTWLHVNVESHDQEGEDVLLTIPYITQNFSVLHGIEPIRSILIGDKRPCTEILAWTTPGADVEVFQCASADLDDTEVTSRSAACFMFTAQDSVSWDSGVPTAIFDALLTLLPLNSVSTFTSQNHTRLSKGFWLRHAPKLPFLEQARLVPTAVREFLKMLAEELPPDSDGPQLPMLTKLILHKVPFDRATLRHLRNTLIERVEQGVSLECLDLHSCTVEKRAIELLAEIVVDVNAPKRDETPEYLFV